MPHETTQKLLERATRSNGFIERAGFVRGMGARLVRPRLDSIKPADLMEVYLIEMEQPSELK